MSKKVWGNATWYLFHTLAEKLKPEFSSEASELFRQINLICRNLPCPECAQHASDNLKSANTKSIDSREKIIEFLWQFHNKVNGQTGKKLNFTRDQCKQKYSLAVSRIIYTNFLSVFKMNARNDRAMMNSYRRQSSIKHFEKYMNENSYKYYG